MLTVFEDREVAFGSVGMDGLIGPRHVLILAVAHEAVIGEVAVQLPVLPRLIGHDPAFPRDVFLEDRHQSRGLDVIDDYGSGLNEPEIITR